MMDNAEPHKHSNAFNFIKTAAGALPLRCSSPSCPFLLPASAEFFRKECIVAYRFSLKFFTIESTFKFFLFQSTLTVLSHSHAH